MAQTDPLSLIPPGSQYDNLRQALARLKMDFPEQYANLSNQSQRVTGWVNEIKSGTGRDADQIRDDIVENIVGVDRLMAKYKITREQANRLILGANEGGINFSQLPDTDPTDDAFKGQKLNNVPGRPEVWKVGKSVYLVYMVPGTEADPVYMAWAATGPEDVQSWFGPGKDIVYDRELTPAEWRAMGAVNFGSTDEIPPGAENPFAGWAQTLRVEAASQPWILDDDYQRLMAMARIEGRGLTDAELASTQWWKKHTAAERRWMITYHGDPSTAAQMMDDKKLQITQAIQAAGGGQRVSQAIINYMAAEAVQGRWTDTYLNSQIRALTDRTSGIAIDPGLAGLNIGTVGQTTEGEDVVRQLLSTWLGPAFGQWDQAEIKRIAGTFRNDPDAQRAFEESLKDQRLAMFPEYTDRETSYAAIANTWKNWWLGQWGEMPDEKDNLFIDVMKRNDLTESGKILRKEGLSRGVAKVRADLSQAGISLGGSERNPVLR